MHYPVEGTGAGQGYEPRYQLYNCEHSLQREDSIPTQCLRLRQAWLPTLHQNQTQLLNPKAMAKSSVFGLLEKIFCGKIVTDKELSTQYIYCHSTAKVSCLIWSDMMFFPQNSSHAACRPLVISSIQTRLPVPVSDL